MESSKVRMLSEIGLLASYPFQLLWMKSMAFPIKSGGLFPTLSSMFATWKFITSQKGWIAVYRGYWFYRFKIEVERKRTRSFDFSSLVLFYPLSVILTRIAISDTSLFQVLKSTIDHDGYLGLYKGLVPTLVAKYMSYSVDLLIQKIEKTLDLNTNDCLILEASAAALTLSFTLPLVRFAAVLQSQSQSDLFAPVQSHLEIVKSLEWREMLICMCFSSGLAFSVFFLKIRN